MRQKIDVDAWMAQLKPPSNRPLTQEELDRWTANRAPTPPGWRENKLKQFDPPIEVGAGGEWQIDSMQIMRNGKDLGLGSKISLATIDGHDFQTDQVFLPADQPTHTVAEAVQVPDTDCARLVANVIRGPEKVGDRLFDATYAAKKTTARLTDVVPNVHPQFSDLTIKSHRGIPFGGADFSSGTTERQFPDMMRSNPQCMLPEAHFLKMKHVVLAAERRLQAIARQKGEPEPRFTPRVRGFLSAIVNAASEAGVPSEDEKQLLTPHNYFLYEPRSTFVWRYYMNLDQEERSVARGLLLKFSDELPTVLSHAMKEVSGLGGDMPLSSVPYDGYNRQDKYLWPTHEQFYESVIHGTPDAPTHDAISNLRGYGPNYALGAWKTGSVDPSGDLDKNVAGYTTNHFRFRPSTNVLSNVAEYMTLWYSRFNPHLVSTADKEAVVNAFENAVALSFAAAAFNGLHDRFLDEREKDPGRAGRALVEAVHGTAIDPGSRKPIRQGQVGVDEDWTALHQAVSDLQPLLYLLERHENEPQWNALRQAHEALMGCLKSDPARIDSDVLESVLDRFCRALFDCDGYGGSRRERHKAVD